MKNSPKSGWRNKYLRAGIAFSAAGALALIVSAVGERIGGEDRMAEGWGGEAAATLAHKAAILSPVSIANACGLGASSCFKCHNGKRAAAPTSDAGKAPWHAHHAKVNNSCVGCHSGNPRMMKEGMAHKNLLSKPRGSAEACGGCHKSDLAKVLNAYQGVPGEK